MPPAIRLVVGLGNPGPSYADTRHNAGQWFLQALAHQHGVRLQADKRFFGETARFAALQGDVCLLFPTTFMNRSGLAVAALAQFYKIKPEEILVVHDELDLAPGQLRLKLGGGSAGHNGIKSIAAQLGTPQFWRARLGIGHPRTLGLNQAVADFVLHRPSASDQADIELAVGALQKAMPAVLAGNFSLG